MRILLDTRLRVLAQGYHRPDEIPHTESVVDVVGKSKDHPIPPRGVIMMLLMLLSSHQDPGLLEERD